MKRDKYLDDVLDKIRQGDPVSISDAILAVHYQAELREYKKSQSFIEKLKRFFLNF